MMKKLLPLILCVVLSLCLVPEADAKSQTFTLMVYLCGTDLESDGGAATADLEEMVAAGVPKGGDLTVYIQTGGTKSWQTRGITDRKVERWTLSGKGLSKVDSVGSASMGDVSTFADFLVYGFDNYPADRYGLIMWDHGSGASGGLCYDEMTGDPLYYPEIYEGLEKARSRSGVSQKFAFIGFDACLMASYELANHLAPFADYMIASEELEPGSGWAYDEWLGDLAENPGMDIPTLGKKIVDSFIRSNSGFFRGDYATLSVCDLNRLDTLQAAVEELGASLTSELNTDFTGISRLRQNMRSFGEVSSNVASDMIDLTVFADVYGRYDAAAAKKVKSALNDVVVYSRYTSNLSNVSGMSILVPYATRSDFSTYMPYYETKNLSPNYSAFVKGMAQQMTSGSTSGLWGNISVSQQSIQEAQVDWFGQYAQDQEAYSENASSLWDEWYGSDTQESSDFSLGSFLSYLFSEDDSSYNTDYDSSASSLWGDLDDDTDTSFTSDSTPSLDDFINSLLGDEDSQQDSSASSVTVQTGDGDVTLDNPFAGTDSEYAYTVTLTQDQLNSLGKVEANLMLDVSDPDFECYVELGYVQDVITDWNNGKIYGLFDGTWATLDGQMVCMYDQIANENYIRSLIPVMVNGRNTYLLVIFDESTPGGRVAGYTDGYTEAGLPARQVWGLEKGDVVIPQYSLIYWDDDDEQQEEPFEGDPITVGRDGGIPFAIDAVETDADYVYGFCLTDIYGDSVFTDFTLISF